MKSFESFESFKSIELMLASANKHKLSEIQECIVHGRVQGRVQIIGAPFSLDVEESGTSYRENSLIKAAAYYRKFKVPTLADDSGLEVLALPGELGIYSARFGENTSENTSVNISYEEKCLLLLDKLDRAEKLGNIENCNIEKYNIENKEKREVVGRNAYFICVLCCYLSPHEIYFFEGRLDGKIGRTLEGDGGFGFDPVFIPDGAVAVAVAGVDADLINSSAPTLAMLPEWKRENSHRARACRRLCEFLIGRSGGFSHNHNF
ncbi:MAG: non-canonical purine NTP pyrophosphatase [Oligoflexia bacterium]|nr:non-canonical purine NTP pyrophosphatase [Oligoflexia bacterium]